MHYILVLIYYSIETCSRTVMRLNGYARPVFLSLAAKRMLVGYQQVDPASGAVLPASKDPRLTDRTEIRLRSGGIKVCQFSIESIIYSNIPRGYYIPGLPFHRFRSWYDLFLIGYNRSGLHTRPQVPALRPLVESSRQSWMITRLAISY